MRTLRFFVIFLITLILGLITLLIMAIYHTSYDPKDSIVYVESISDESLKNGMGFVYKKDDNIDYIVTNYHVVASSNYIYVYNLKNEKERASLVDFDAYTDIAILKLDDSLKLKSIKKPTIELKEKTEIYYFNINKNSIESGSILSLNNEITLTANYGNSFYNAISIKGDIENGNSGGPVFNNKEEFVGMISLKDEETNNGYYVDYDLINDIVTKLENHSLVRPNIGGAFASSTNVDAITNVGLAVPNLQGVVILDVAESSTLSKNGIIKGDIITKINNKDIIDVIGLQREIYSHDIGDTITLEYYRHDALNTVSVLLER